jgi:ketosteroid isomerase-like protein
VRARRPRVERPDDYEEVASRFFAAAAGGDIQALMDVMAPDVVLLTDGGGKKQAALRPIHGPDKIARWFAGIVATAGDVSAEWGTANGGPAIMIHVDGELDSVASVTVKDGMVSEIFIVRNPDKLTSVTEPVDIARG